MSVTASRRASGFTHGIGCRRRGDDPTIVWCSMISPAPSWGSACRTLHPGPRRLTTPMIPRLRIVERRSRGTTAVGRRV
jgi:hypothetical protein